MCTSSRRVQENGRCTGHYRDSLFRVKPVTDRAYLRLPDVGNDVDDFLRLTDRKNKIICWVREGRSERA